MPTKKSRTFGGKKKRAHTQRKRPGGGKPKKPAKKTFSRLAAKTNRPEFHVKKSSYSKTARLSVLASAAARQHLIEMGGENTIDIIREFDRDMSDDELAKKTGIKTSDVRVVLNRLHTCGLFTYTRVRDRDSGWYSYIWKMSEGRLREFSKGIDEPHLEDMAEAVEEDYLKKNYQGGSARPVVVMNVFEARRRRPG